VVAQVSQMMLFDDCAWPVPVADRSQNLMRPSGSGHRPLLPPLLSREALKSLQKMLMEELAPIEEIWERRN
jgi:hypothetical protein